MRLWHESLLSKLPRQQLLGQHRECCALRGAGWGRKHSVVNYVFTHDPEYLYVYHCRVIDEMKNRGYHPDEIWYNASYRGKTLGYDPHFCGDEYAYTRHPVYDEHNDEYLKECIDNLKSKGIDIDESTL